MKNVRWGVIGAGGIAARRTIPEFKRMVSDAEIVSVMDVAADRVREVAARFGIPHSCVTERELLAQNIDAVYIATPLNRHAEQVIQAAAAGKHILCEKLLAANLAEVDRIEAAVAKAGVRFMLGFCMRFNVYHAKARELVQTGALGQMVMGRAELSCWYPPIADAWRQDASISHGGALIDMGIHCLDLLEWIMDARIVEVAGFQDMMTHAYRTRIEDASTLVLRLDNGAHGIADNYFNLPDAAVRNALELHGTRGSIYGQGTVGQDPTGKMYGILQERETGYDANQVRNAEPRRVDYNLEGIGLYGQMIDAFSRCIRENRTPPITLEDGRHSVRVVEAVYRSVREKKTIAVGS